MRRPIVLCVDDEELPLTLRKLVLEKQGYEVITARSASEALRALGQRNVDLVLTDQLMPETTGTELADSINAQWPDLPVLLLTGINEVPADGWHANILIGKAEGPAAMCAKISKALFGERDNAMQV